MCYTAQAKAVHVSPIFFSQGIRLEAGEPPSNRTIACALETYGQAVHPRVERASIWRQFWSRLRPNASTIVDRTGTNGSVFNV